MFRTAYYCSSPAAAPTRAQLIASRPDSASPGPRATSAAIGTAATTTRPACGPPPQGSEVTATAILSTAEVTAHLSTAEVTAILSIAEVTAILSTAEVTAHLSTA